MLDTVDAALDELLEDQEPKLPKGCTAKEALQMELRGEVRLTPSQFRAAKELLPYENPKLTAVATVNIDQNFAVALEKAIERSRAPYVPRPALLPPVEHSRDEVRGNFPVR